MRTRFPRKNWIFMSLFFKLTMMLKKYYKNKIAFSIKGHQNNTQCTKKSLFQSLPALEQSAAAISWHMVTQARTKRGVLDHKHQSYFKMEFSREKFSKNLTLAVSIPETILWWKPVQLLISDCCAFTLTWQFQRYHIPILMWRYRMTFELHGLQFQEGHAIPSKCLTSEKINTKQSG